MIALGLCITGVMFGATTTWEEAVLPDLVVLLDFTDFFSFFFEALFFPMISQIKIETVAQENDCFGKRLICNYF